MCGIEIDSADPIQRWREGVAACRGAFTDERLRELSLAYDLDSGGYTFENPESPELQSFGAAIWDDPDPDYVPWIVGSGPWSDFYGLDCPVYAFSPDFTVREWPESVAIDGERYRLIRSGWLHESERSCWCEGAPECDRCEDALVMSESGNWALYAWEEVTP